MSTNPGRREFLKRIGITAGASVFGLSVPTSSSVAQQIDRNQYTICRGTMYETEVYTIESPNEGDTVFLFGGIHGNERGGIEAAHLATGYTIDCGTLFIIPEANKPAVRRDNNHGPEGDLNRQFPIGSEPTTTVARGIWEEISDADPDHLIDMHNATGIYGIDGIGQSIFPTTDAVTTAANTVEYMNTTHLPETGLLRDHDFQVGPAISEQHPLLIHKAAADQNISGWLVEVTRTDLDIAEMAFLHDMVTRKLLDQIDIDVISEPIYSNPL